MRSIPAMMQAPDWSDYQVFLAIARTGQMARAASSLALDATTVGRRLRRLEARLGATLFEQTREGQVLTEAGEALLVEVEAMAQSAGRIAEHAAGGGPSGLLRVSLTEGFGSVVVAPALGDFARAHPRLVIDLVGSTGLLSPSKREADLAVTLSRPRAGPVVAGKLSDYRLRLYAAPSYLAECAPIRSGEDLGAGHRLVGYVPDLLNAPELRYLDEFGPGLTATLRSPSILAQQAMLVAGAGVGVLPCFIGDADPRLVPVLAERTILRSFWLVMHKDTHSLARVRVFRDWLVELAAVSRARLLGK